MPGKMGISSHNAGEQLVVSCLATKFLAHIKHAVYLSTCSSVCLSVCLFLCIYGSSSNQKVQKFQASPLTVLLNLHIQYVELYACLDVPGNVPGGADERGCMLACSLCHRVSPGFTFP